MCLGVLLPLCVGACSIENGNLLSEYLNAPDLAWIHFGGVVSLGDASASFLVVDLILVSLPLLLVNGHV